MVLPLEIGVDAQSKSKRGEQPASVVRQVTNDSRNAAPRARRWAVVASALFALAVPARLPAAPAILVVGDSWARLVYDNGSLQTVLAAHGHPEVVVRGDDTSIDGSTAAEWAQASMLQLLTDELTAHPEIEVVVVFLGGNDFLAGQSGGGWYVGIDPAARTALFDGIESDLATLVDHLLGLDSDLEIVLSSYDYPNFVETLTGLGAFVCVPLWDDLGDPTPYQINSTATLMDARQQAIAATRPAVVPVANWGLMQNLYGYPSLDIDPGVLPLPGDPTLPSPPEAMRWGIDCFHLAPGGYAGIAERLWQVALASHFDGLFSDGFESGDLAAWDLSVGGSP